MTVRDVEARLERLSLVCEALWTLVRERTGLTEEDIVQRMTDLDLTDGKLDGRRQKSNTCASCGRSVARRRRVCLYCGAVIGKEDAFDGV